MRTIESVVRECGDRLSELADRSIWLVGKGSGNLRKFYCSLKFRQGWGSGWRYDMDCMTPANAPAAEVNEILRPLVTAGRGDCIWWSSDTAVVLANWKVLHGRGPEPDKDHKYLLHALKRGSERSARKSIGVTQALSLCRTLFPEFTESDYNVAVALTNRRNEELHSGGAAFEEYAAKQWLPGFYSACRSLSVGMGESLVTLFGEDEAGVAAEVLTEVQKDVKQRVLSSIAAHRKVFEEKPQLEQETAKRRASELGIELSKQRHHRVNCPACGSVATVQGTPFGKEYVTHKDAEVLVKQAVSPSGFSCPVCSLKLRGYAELDAAGLGGQHTRTTTFSPEEYYGLVPQDDLDRYLEDARSAGEEYDNEG